VDYVNGELYVERPAAAANAAAAGPRRRARPAQRISGRRGGHFHAEQDRLFTLETPTDGAHVLKLFASYSFGTPAATSTITARLDNATNQLYHNHLNYLKDLVPEVGRNFKVLYSVKF
jgi:outer membrane receptor protein involved in Fe transport